MVVLDEAQRIKNRESKTAEVVCGLRRARSWALTGTPIENRTEDLINLFAFVDPDRIPRETPPRCLPQLTADCILRRTKEDVLTDLPAKVVRDAFLDLTPAQREAYDLAENEGIVRLNELGDTITVQHVFELVMRLKQICNFDPLTGQSAKLDQLRGPGGSRRQRPQGDHLFAVGEAARLPGSGNSRVWTAPVPRADSTP